MEVVGPVPRRPPVGHRARGLQRRRRRVGVRSPTTTPGRAPTAGARTAWAASATAGSTSASASPCGTSRDPILKERLFGLTNDEGNHGEDVKEYWWALDSTPTHSWMRWLYKYPQRRVPLRPAGRREPPPRTRSSPSTSWSTPACSTTTATSTSTVTYAKAGARRHLHRDRVHEPRPRRRRRCTCCRTLWFRNTWSWGRDDRRPRLRRRTAGRRRRRPRRSLGDGYWLGGADGDPRPAAVLRERDQHRAAVGHAERARRTPRTASTTTSSGGARRRSTPTRTGTKAAAWYRLDVAAGRDGRRSGCG